MDVDAFEPGTIPGLDPDVLNRVLGSGACERDAATLPLPEKRYVVIMNLIKGRERQHASLIEDLFRSQAGRLRAINGFVVREWKQTHETQAYWVGSAALVPRRVLKGAITRKLTIVELATQCGVSSQLIQFVRRFLDLLHRFPQRDFVAIALGLSLGHGDNRPALKALVVWSGMRSHFDACSRVCRSRDDLCRMASKDFKSVSRSTWHG